MKQSYVLIISLITLIVCSVGTGVIIGVKFDEYNNRYKINSFIKDINNFSDCENMSLKETTMCLNKYIKSIYNYTSRDERKYKEGEGTLEDVIKNGGDCSDYTNLYISFFKSLGFNAEGMILSGSKSKTSHVFVIAWDEEVNNYCVMDQTKVLDCVRILDSDPNKKLKGGN